VTINRIAPAVVALDRNEAEENLTPPVGDNSGAAAPPADLATPAADQDAAAPGADEGGDE